MLTKDLIKEKIKNSLPGYTGKPDSFLKRHAAVGLLVFIILAILFGYLIYQRFLIIKQEQKKEAYVVVEAAKEKLQEAFTNSLLATKILSFFIDNNGAVKNFDSVAAQILSTNKNIDALQLVPGGVIQYMYPLKGNENVIGYNILTDPARNKEAFKAIEKKELFFSGPHKLIQGGFGIVGRLPVFRNGKFWGFSAVVIKMATLLKATGIDRTGKDGYYYQLSKINPNTKKQEFFIPHVKTALKNYLFSLDIPIGDWKLSVEPVDVNKSLPEIYILALIGFLFSIFGGIFVFEIFRRPEKLERLVKERTSELKGSENKYRSVIDRVSDAFVSLDKDWNYTFVNKKAGEIFARKPETLIGKNIWTEFPEWKDQPFYHVYYRAMETQTYQYLEEYYPGVDKWFESHVYPANDGLTIFFKDVTEIKQVLLALKINEEKYRILIEQASDGIVITDLAGEILEVNHSIKQMLGYAGEEMIGYPLTVFLPDDDIAAIPLRINELMQGKNLMYERRLLKKDGTFLDVEINSKMASSHTLIGFIRDITQRIKISADLKKSIERYKLIAAATNDVIWDHDFENNITWGNKSLYQLYGVEAGTTAINFEMFINQIHPDDQEGIKTGFEEAVKNRQSSITEEFRFKNAEGEYRIFYDRAFIKYDDVGNPERILGVMLDITEREKAAELLQKSYKDIRQLASNLQSIREDERTNIAREIHDELGQQLTGLKMDLHWLTRKINSADEEVIKKMKESVDLINATITSVRKIATDLRPSILDDLGLLAALEWQGEEFEKRSGTKVKFINEAGDLTVKPEVATAIFRIYQELLTNIARHANAALVTASLYIVADILYFSIKDDGNGFNLVTISNKKTLGLLGIKERTILIGGTYEIKTKPGEGSETIISIPVKIATV